MIPLTIIRLFENGRPRRPQFVGNRGSTRSHCSSVIASNRDFSFTPPVSRDPHLTYRRHTLARRQVIVSGCGNQGYEPTVCNPTRHPRRSRPVSPHGAEVNRVEASTRDKVTAPRRKTGPQPQWPTPTGETTSAHQTSSEHQLTRTSSKDCTTCRTTAAGSSEAMMARTIATPATPVAAKAGTSATWTSPIATTGRLLAPTKAGYP